MYYLTHKRIIIENSPCAINAICVINSFCVNNAKRVKPLKSRNHRQEFNITKKTLRWCHKSVHKCSWEKWWNNGGLNANWVNDAICVKEKLMYYHGLEDWKYDYGKIHDE